jgi:hypothetical protein
MAYMLVCGMTIHDRLTTAQHKSIIFALCSPLSYRANGQSSVGIRERVSRVVRNEGR